MMDIFENVKKKFGFGCMRLPMKGSEVDKEEFSEMVDTFLENGFNYFDTAHGYLGGLSETALRECLTSRYPRDRYILAFFKKCRAYETALELKKEGKIRHFGISFHDRADVLEQILTEYPQIEVVQIQFNYLDYEDPAVESRKCYEVCCKYGKPVIVMEPVKGGNLVNLPEDAAAVLDELHGGSPASYAIRFAAGFDGIRMVLSGMSSMEQMEDNISYMKDFRPLSETEKKAIDKVRESFQSKNLIQCTACRYCTAGCPKQISIPDLFACMNAKKIFHDWNTDYYYNNVHTVNNGKASDCIKCGKCEKACPQHLPIRQQLQRNYCVFWLKDQTNYYIEEFAGILRKLLL